MESLTILGGLLFVAGTLGESVLTLGLSKAVQMTLQHVARLEPEANHTVIQAVHRAYLQTVLTVVEECQRDPEIKIFSPVSIKDRMMVADTERAWLRTTSRNIQTELRDLPKYLPPARKALDDIDPALLVLAGKESVEARIAEFKAQLAQQILTDFSGGYRPQRFVEMVRGDWRGSSAVSATGVNICKLLCDNFAKELETNQDVHNMFTSQILTDIGLTADMLQQQLAQVSRQISKHLLQLTIEITELREQMNTRFDRLAQPIQEILQQLSGNPELQRYIDRSPRLGNLVPDFVGRDGDRDRLVRVLKGAAAQGGAIGCIWGMTGAGKTQLALAIVQQLKPDFPDKLVEVNLKEEDTPLDPKHVLQKIIQYTFPKWPVDGKPLEQLQSDYRSLLSDKRVVILADNAVDEDQVAPLVPPPGSVLLITSQQHFMLDGMTPDHIIHLRGLPAEDAIPFVLKLCSRLDPASTEKLAKYCSYLPLALRVSAKTLEVEKVLDVHEYLKRLEQESTRLAIFTNVKDGSNVIKAALRLSYSSLSPDDQTTLRQLSLCRASFDRAAAAAIRGLPDADTLTHIRRLHLRSLLDEALPKRYVFNDLVRLFADEEMDDSEREAAQQRYIAYYTLLASKYVAHLEAGEARAALDQFELDREHLRIALRWTIDRKDATTAIQLTSALWRLWDALGYLPEERGLLNEVLAIVQGMAENDPALALERAAVLTGASFHALTQGDITSAERLLRQGLNLYRNVDDVEGLARSLNNLAEAAMMHERYAVAEPLLNESRELFRALGDTRREAVVIGNLSYVAQAKEDYPLAIQYSETSLDMLAQLPNTERESATIHHNLANIFWAQKDYPQARNIHETVLQIREELGSKPDIAASHDGLGWAYLGLQDLDSAERHFGQSLGMFQEIDDPDGLRWSLEGVARVALARRQFERAVKLLMAVSRLQRKEALTLYLDELAAARDGLLPEQYDAAEAKGRGLTREAAVALALAPSL